MTHIVACSSIHLWVSNISGRITRAGPFGGPDRGDPIDSAAYFSEALDASPESSLDIRHGEAAKGLPEAVLLVFVNKTGLHLSVARMRLSHSPQTTWGGWMDG